MQLPLKDWLRGFSELEKIVSEISCGSLRKVDSYSDHFVYCTALLIRDPGQESDTHLAAVPVIF